MGIIEKQLKNKIVEPILTRLIKVQRGLKNSQNSGVFVAILCQKKIKETLSANKAIAIVFWDASYGLILVDYLKNCPWSLLCKVIGSFQPYCEKKKVRIRRRIFFFMFSSRQCMRTSTCLCHHHDKSLWIKKELVLYSGYLLDLTLGDYFLFLNLEK